MVYVQNEVVYGWREEEEVAATANERVCFGYCNDHTSWSIDLIARHARSLFKQRRKNLQYNRRLRESQVAKIIVRKRENLFSTEINIFFAIITLRLEMFVRYLKTYVRGIYGK